MDRLQPSSVRATAKLMQNYRVATRVAPDAAFDVFPGPDTTNEVVAIGSDGRVTHLRPDRNGGSAWIETRIPTIARATCVAGVTGGGPTGAMVRLVFFAAPDVPLSVVREQSDGTWSEPARVGTDASVTSRVTARAFGGSVFLARLRERATPHAGYDLDYAEFAGAGTRWIYPVASLDTDSYDIVGAAILGARPQIAYAQTPRLYFAQTTQYEWLWDNAACGNKVEKAKLWRPRPPESYVAMGHYLQANLDPPRGPSLCVRELPSDRASDASLLITFYSDPPMTQVYNDHHGCAAKGTDCSIWTVQAPSGYRALGDLVSQDQESKPSDRVVVVRNDQTTKANLPYSWSDQNSGATHNVEAYQVVAPAGGLATGCFEAQAVALYDHVPQSTTVGYVPLADPPLTSHVTFRRPNSDGGWDVWHRDAGARITTAAFARMPDGEIGVFAVEGGAVRFATSTVAQWITLRGPADRTFVKLVAGVGASGLAQVFALDRDRVLFTAHQNPPGSAAPFTDLVPIADEVTGIALGEARGRIELYATGNGGRFFRIGQDPETTSWTPLEIALSEIDAGADAIEPLETYTTQFLVFDEMGSPAVGREVPLWASSPSTLNVNGRIFMTGPEAPARVRPNAAGEINCIVLTSDLGAPSLKVEAPGANETVSYDPSIGVQDRLAVVTGKQLVEAEDASGNKLLQGDEAIASADDIAASLNQLMDMADEAAATDEELAARAGARAAGRRHRRARLRRHAGDGFADDVRRLPAQRWVLTFEGKRARFRVLDAGEDVVATGIFTRIDWGSLWQSVKSEIASILEMAWDGVKFIMDYMMDGMRYTMHAAIDKVRQFVEAAYGVFVKIGTAFQQVFEWLAYVFHWGDILDTQEAVTWMLGEGIAFVVRAIPELRRRFDDKLRGIEDKVEGALDGVIEKLAERFGGDVTMGDIADQMPPSEEAEENAGTNIALSGLLDMSAMGRTEVPASADDGDMDWSLGGSLLDPILAALSGFQGSEGFARALEYFKQIGSQPRRAPQLVMSAFLEIVKALAVDGIELFRVVIDAILEGTAIALAGVGELLAKAWQVPLLTPLFAYVTEAAGRPARPLTAANLLGLIVAIPATVVHKVKYDTAPFGDGKLDAFKSYFTADALLSRSGLGPAVALPQVVYTDIDWQRWGGVALAVLAGGSALLDLATDLVYVSPKKIENTWLRAGYSVLGLTLFASEITMQVLAAPWLYSDYTQLLDPISWGLHLLLPGFDACALIVSLRRGTGVVAKNLNDEGVLGTCAIGVVYLLLGPTLAIVQGEWDGAHIALLIADVLGSFVIAAKVLRLRELHLMVGEALVPGQPPHLAKVEGRGLCTIALAGVDLIAGGVAVAATAAAMNLADD